MAELITEDVPRFWQAFDVLDAADAAEQFRHLYLDPGSAGVRAFTPERIVSAQHLLDVVRSRRNFYASIRDRSLTTIREVRPRLEAILRRLGEVVPDAPDNDVYFVVGALNSGGTLGREDGRAFAVIGLEFFSADQDTVTHELNAWESSVVGPPERLPAIVAHELIHTLQPSLATPDQTLLLHCLAEGAAEYLGELVSGEVINPRLHDYGLAHENDLRARFRQDLAAGTGPEAWLYQGNKAVDEPADLGYFMGARIMRAYHERHRDRPNVIHDLLHRALLDPEEFTRQSSYLT